MASYFAIEDKEVTACGKEEERDVETLLECV